VQDLTNFSWSGVLEDEELQVQDVIAVGGSLRTSNPPCSSIPADSSRSAAGDQASSDPADSPIPEAKQTGNSSSSFIFQW
jgi:hypothetical protein